MKIINISIAIVKKNDQSYLIALRPSDSHQGGKWEFPGGKVEENETPEEAMLRELHEEVGLVATDYTLFEKLFFDYGDKQLNLHFYLVTKFTGEAFGKEGQPIKWVSHKALESYDFPEANKTVIAKL
ncbi:8-oxo-dGTP diphosphatase MutT [Psychromonas sp. Urea-02u-13]|uniref:8-oxo-dGTP diphosphatase MutT n=1 Tax=Psychromonas sp. Urea-02u-13 TaxID=2058326 RepID=UPI000C34BA61|nr:8-oxo-dGTP diphosphatase MutT [Psychromonas sp. Urea-02u-13]PKG38353.1 8-oxo-dGTP diphosphatase MutT [Psychromonas sp. Urea-02u-13]